MVGPGEPNGPLTDEDRELLVTALGIEVYGGQPAQPSSSSPQVSDMPPPAGGGRQMVPNSPVPMALLNSPLGPPASITYPQQVLGSLYSDASGPNISFDNRLFPGSHASFNNFLPPSVHSTSTHVLPALHNISCGRPNYGLSQPFGAPQGTPYQVAGSVPLSFTSPLDNSFHNDISHPLHLNPAFDPHPSELDLFVQTEAQAQMNNSKDLYAEETQEMSLSVPSSTYFESLMGDSVLEADSVTRQSEIRAILNKDKVPVATERDDASERGRKTRKRKMNKLEPGQKRRAPKMVDVLPYNDPPTWPPRRRKHSKMTEMEKEQIDAANADIDRQVKEWNKKKNNESAKRGRQRRQNRVNRLTEDLAQAQAERNFWKARAVTRGASEEEWDVVPEGVRDDLVADFRIDPDDLLLPPEDDF
ncbi:uncharacterized protein VDAG_00634 [Verticillium dahliae VdLs.17]|uniref:BZIP domain-containing protein n=2 Tax=Verticillium dahliae TaxID=27337 RepID=G2WQJ2_VERDV|nr:uncharacterized protein VDAG_00634 [Verticillium dahliae VdLs.17]EGY13952.1 hypothetical protein VDAG_00634 [Verticillium dahliae VdLs.17]KAH6710427.1 hypothetical protein EV126DRAFT_476448 [Verticillium dahliae]